MSASSAAVRPETSEDCAGGLMAVARLGPIAKDFGIANVPVRILGITLATLTYALSLNHVMNGITRPVLGWVSDRIGREMTMFCAFMLERLGNLALMVFGHSAVSFVVLSGLVFLSVVAIFNIIAAVMAIAVLYPARCKLTGRVS